MMSGQPFLARLASEILVCASAWAMVSILMSTLPFISFWYSVACGIRGVSTQIRMEGLPLEDEDPDEHPVRATPTAITATSATASRFIGASFHAVRERKKASSLQ